MKNLSIMKNPLAALVAPLLLLAPLVQAGTPLQTKTPEAARSLLPIGLLPKQNQLNLAIGLPVRDQQKLNAFLRDLYNPASPNYRHFMTPESFTNRFGPTEQDYQAVINFAHSHGLTVTATHPNRMILDVTGSVTDVERTFHVTLRTFQHPTENRTFYAPDVDPTIDEILPILDVSGLDNYWLPRPNLRLRNDLSANASPKLGSGPGGSYIGSDFRHAYVPGVTLNGAGQTVGLLEFAGYKASAITAYESQAGLPSVTLQNVLIDGATGASGSGNDEVCLDIEVALAMAPGLSKIIVYEAPNPSPWVDILNRMTNDNLAEELSCSWGGGPANGAAEQIFQQMAAQGQTFFNATGDSDAYTGSIPFPSDSPNIVQVGGTTLSTVSAGGAWSSETTWNWGNGTGSSGGISTVYSIPSWQQGVSMANNQGSTTKRNLPDVALTADNVYVVYSTSTTGVFGGTSCAAPLWAGFTALVNQQTAANSQQPVGFINPAVYSIGKGGTYSSNFHDITTGNNITNQSGGKFSAVTGYDLCTGWGTPNGNLINALAGSGGGGTNYTVTTSVSPANSGTTTGDGSYASGSSVTVTANQNNGFTFTNWTENGQFVSGSASYTFNINANRNLVANFTTSGQQNYTITLKASPLKGGTVSGGGTFSSGSSVTVTATPAAQFHFTNWTQSGNVVSTSANYTFTVTKNRTLVAHFVHN